MNLSRQFKMASLLIFLIIGTILWVLSRAISPEMVKEYVNSQLAALTSLPSHINGGVEWNLFPQPGIKISTIELGDGTTPENYSLKIDNLFLHLKIIPLFRGKFEFSFLEVKGFKLQLNKASTNIIKFGDNIKTVDSAKQTANTPPAPPFKIEKILLSNGQVTIVRDNQTIKLSNLQIGMDNINLQQNATPFQLKTKATFFNANQLLSSGQVQFKGSTNLLNAYLNNPTMNFKNALLTGQLNIQKAQFHEFKINKISANTHFKNSVLHLNPLTIKLYQGESIGNLSFNFSEKKINLDQTATNINSEKLSNDLFNTKLVKGNLDVSIHTQTDFQNTNWQDSTSGSGNISIKDGAIESINFNKLIAITSSKINNLLPGKNLIVKPVLLPGSFDDTAFFSGNTPFKLMTFKYHIANAILYSDALFMQTDTMQLKGDGMLNLKDYAIESHILTTVNVAEKKINEVQSLLGGSFPLLVQGSLTKPVISPDLKKIAPIITRLLLKDTLSKPIKEGKEHLLSMIKALN